MWMTTLQSYSTLQHLSHTLWSTFGLLPNVAWMIGSGNQKSPWIVGDSMPWAATYLHHAASTTKTGSNHHLASPIILPCDSPAPARLVECTVNC